MRHSSAWWSKYGNLEPANEQDSSPAPPDTVGKLAAVPPPAPLTETSRGSSNSAADHVHVHGPMPMEDDHDHDDGGGGGDHCLVQSGDDLHESACPPASHEPAATPVTEASGSTKTKAERTEKVRLLCLHFASDV